MFTIIGLMLTGMLLGYLLRKRNLSKIHKVITVLIWVLLFILGIEVGGNEQIIKGLHTIGLEAVLYIQHDGRKGRVGHIAEYFVIIHSQNSQILGDLNVADTADFGYA